MRCTGHLFATDPELIPVPRERSPFLILNRCPNISMESALAQSKSENPPLLSPSSPCIVCSAARISVQRRHGAAIHRPATTAILSQVSNKALHRTLLSYLLLPQQINQVLNLSPTYEPGECLSKGQSGPNNAKLLCLKPRIIRVGLPSCVQMIDNHTQSL